MNLSKLFDLQRQLDERIVMEKGLEWQFLLPQKILALQVELGELANEWRGFKFWKVDPRPSNKVLEEYVDCLHFILSIGLEIEETPDVVPTLKYFTAFDNFITTMYWASVLHQDNYYMELFKCFIGLGEHLGFTWQQIEQAYLDKNKVNHDRQASGY